MVTAKKRRLTVARRWSSGPRWKTGAAACVVLASGGYPGQFDTGYKINGLDIASQNAYIFHAGTKLFEAAEGSPVPTAFVAVTVHV